MEPKPVTSSDLNFLVFRYLQESGFTHSAFALEYEAGINKSSVDGHLIPPGALVTFVQKGLRYVELEANIHANDAVGDDDFSFLQPLDLITKSVNELRDLVRDRKEILLKKTSSAQEKAKDSDLKKNHEHKLEGGWEVSEKGKDNGKKDKGKEKTVEKRDGQNENSERRTENELPRDRDDTAIFKSDDVVPHGSESMGNCADAANSSIEFSSSDVTILEGHTSEVFSCAWSPGDSLLASGSGDSTARIWALPSGHCGSDLRKWLCNAVVLKHLKRKTNEMSKDVTTLDWNFNGTLLATGSYDGDARIWSKEGELQDTLTKHKGPIFSLKWNQRGNFLLSGSVDKTAIVWDVKSGELRQQFCFHSAPTLDVDWRNNVTFASCSIDSMIYFCKVGEARPVKTFIGHQGEVNAVKWDPTGSLLASCSDDSTAKVWSLKQDKCIYDFKEHQKEIYTIRWSPTGLGRSNPNRQLILATASVDSTVKLWDIEAGKLLRTLDGHSAAVYTIAFSPDGELLVSGSVDQSLLVWSVKEGKIVRTYRAGRGGIFEVCWNPAGDKIAASFANSTVCVLDFRV